MGSAKQIIVKAISRDDANAICARFHYSGKHVMSSQLHLGVFWEGRLEGVMQFGSPIDKRKTITLVADTPWNGFLELNRMAFGPALPRNSESRALAIAFKLIRKHYPHIQWVVSFSDGTQCGDGTIYRASGFVLTAIKANETIVRLKTGKIAAKHGSQAGRVDFTGAKPLPGFQLRYVYFLDKEARSRLTVKEIPFSEIQRLGAGMYRGQKKRAGSIAIDALAFQDREGGETPTPALHLSSTEEA